MDATPVPVSRIPLGAAARATAVANSVRSVDRAILLLLALGDWDGDAGVTEIARRLGLHKSTVSRLLATLLKRGLVDQDHESGKYRLGSAMIRLGGHAEKTLDLRSLALPELTNLASFVKETTTLGTLAKDTVLLIAWSDSGGVGRQRVGPNLPLHATAPGKVLLAGRPEREVIRLSKIGFTPYTPNTITRADLLLEEIARVRSRGYATAFGEHESVVNAVAMPVFDQRGAVAAALEVRAYGTRIQYGRVPELVESMRVAAAAITEQIGGVAATG